MFNRVVVNALQNLLTLKTSENAVFSRTAASAAAAARKKSQDSQNETETTTTPKKKKPMTARRLAYTSPKRDLLFGVHPVGIALAEKRRTFYKLFLKKSVLRQEATAEDNIEEIMEMVNARGIPIHYKHRRELDYFCNGAVHQGVVLQVSRLKPSSWQENLEIFGKTDEEGKLLVYLDGIQDPMNMGAVIRSCVFLGADSILIPTEKSCKLSAQVSKASSGALECASIHTVEDVHQLMSFVQKLGWDIIGSDSDCMPYEEFEVTPKNRLLIVGNEGHGVNEEIVHFFTSTVSVPGVSSRVNCLNVSVTAAILISHFAKLKKQIFQSTKSS